MMYTLRHIASKTIFLPKPIQIPSDRVLGVVITTLGSRSSSGENPRPKVSPRIEEFRKKLQEELPIEKPPGREVTPIRKLDQKSNPLPKQFEYEPFPDNVNPKTGEINGPKGPEPTRYGDWERKGRCTDF